MTDHSDLIERLENQQKPKGLIKSEPNVLKLDYGPDPLCQEAAAALREQQAEIERLTGDLNDHRIIIEMTSDQRDRIAAERKELKEFLQDFVAAKFEEIVPRDGHLPPESRAESVTPFSTIEAWQDDARAALETDVGIPTSELVKSGKCGA